MKLFFLKNANDQLECLFVFDPAETIPKALRRFEKIGFDKVKCKDISKDIDTLLSSPKNKPRGLPFAHHISYKSTSDYKEIVAGEVYEREVIFYSFYRLNNDSFWKERRGVEQIKRKEYCETEYSVYTDAPVLYYMRIPVEQVARLGWTVRDIPIYENSVYEHAFSSSGSSPLDLFLKDIRPSQARIIPWEFSREEQLDTDSAGYQIMSALIAKYVSAFDFLQAIIEHGNTIGRTTFDGETSGKIQAYITMREPFCQNESERRMLNELRLANLGSASLNWEFALQLLRDGKADLVAYVTPFLRPDQSIDELLEASHAESDVEDLVEMAAQAPDSSRQTNSSPASNGWFAQSGKGGEASSSQSYTDFSLPLF